MYAFTALLYIVGFPIKVGGRSKSNSHRTIAQGYTEKTLLYVVVQLKKNH